MAPILDLTMKEPMKPQLPEGETPNQHELLQQHYYNSLLNGFRSNLYPQLPTDTPRVPLINAPNFPTPAYYPMLPYPPYSIPPYFNPSMYFGQHPMQIPNFVPPAIPLNPYDLPRRESMPQELQYSLGGSQPPPYNIPAFEAYKEYKELAKKTEMATDEETELSINVNMRRNIITSNDKNDPAYVAMRKKNNLAAKKSREARKQKEQEVQLRYFYNAKEYLRLKTELEYHRERLKMTMALPQK